MTTSDDRAIALLYELQTLYRVSLQSYASADLHLSDPSIARELRGFRDRRTKLVTEVEHRLRDLRADPTADPNQTLVLDLKVGMGESPIGAPLAELESSEDEVVGALKRARAEADIDAGTRQLFEQHYEFVQTAHDRVRQLRDTRREDAVSR